MTTTDQARRAGLSNVNANETNQVYRLVPKGRAPRAAAQVILLTGARLGGIGHASARRLCDDGHTVVVAERDAQAGRAAVRDVRTHGGNAWFAHLDAADEQAVERLMHVIDRRWGRLDAVVNNAGWAGEGHDTFLGLDAAGFRARLEANLVAPYVVTRAALSHFFLPRRRGACLYLGSTNGQPGNGTQVGYAAAKCGLSALVRVGATLHGADCRFVLVRPGLVKTDSDGWRRRRQIPGYAIKEAVKIPARRHAHPAEVAALIAFLLGPEAAYLQGCEINFDGGLSAAGSLLPGGGSTSRDDYVQLVDLVARTRMKSAA